MIMIRWFGEWTWSEWSKCWAYDYDIKHLWARKWTGHQWVDPPIDGGPSPWLTVEEVT